MGHTRLVLTGLGPSGTNFGKTLPTPTRTDLERPKLVLTYVRKERVSMGQPLPNSRYGPQRPKGFGPTST